MPAVTNDGFRKIRLESSAGAYQGEIAADQLLDTLTLVSGAGITMSANETSDRVTIGVLGSVTTATINDILYNGNSSNFGLVLDDLTIDNNSLTVNHASNNLTLGVSGTGVIALTSTLQTEHLLPSADITYDLGSPSYRYRDLYLSGSTIYLGSASISAVGSAINLPAGTTINSVDLTDSIVPDQTVHADKFLRTNGATLYWDTIPSQLPSQTGNIGKYLKTDGTTATWETVPTTDLTGYATETYVGTQIGTVNTALNNKAGTTSPAFTSSITLNDAGLFDSFATTYTSTAGGSGFAGAAAYGNGVFVALTNDRTATGSGTAIYSTDNGANWTNTTIPSNSTYWTAVAYGNGKFVGVGYQKGWYEDGSNDVAVSSDGITWSKLDAVNYNLQFMDIAYGNGVFVAVGRGGGIANGYDTSAVTYSLDGGASWSTSNFPDSQKWYGIAYGKGVFVAIGQGTSNSYGAYSTDNGVTWNRITLPVSGSWQSIEYGNGVFVALCNNSTTYVTSTNGISWTTRTFPTSTYWSFGFGGGLFYAAATGSTQAYTSTDGISWTSRTAATSSGYGFGGMASNNIDTFVGVNCRATVAVKNGLRLGARDIAFGNYTLSNTDGRLEFKSGKSPVLSIYNDTVQLPPTINKSLTVTGTSVTISKPLTVTGTLTYQQTEQVWLPKTNANWGVVDHDYSATNIWYHTSITDNFTPNFTNIPWHDGKMFTCTLVLAQGATPRMPTQGFQIGGTPESVYWENNTIPTGTANKVDVVTYRIFRSATGWITLASASKGYWLGY